MPFESDVLEFLEDVDDFWGLGHLFAQKEKENKGDFLGVIFEDTRVLLDDEALQDFFETGFGLELDLK